MLSTILVVILILILIGALPTWGYSSGWGYRPGGIRRSAVDYCDCPRIDGQNMSPMKGRSGIKYCPRVSTAKSIPHKLFS